MFRSIPNLQIDQPGRHGGNVGYNGPIWQDYVNRLLIELCYKAYRAMICRNPVTLIQKYLDAGGENLSHSQAMQNKLYPFKDNFIV